MCQIDAGWMSMSKYCLIPFANCLLVKSRGFVFLFCFLFFCLVFFGGGVFVCFLVCFFLFLDFERYGLLIL